jgi:hypothetical protein
MAHTQLTGRWLTVIAVAVLTHSAPAVAQEFAPATLNGDRPPTISCSDWLLKQSLECPMANTSSVSLEPWEFTTPSTVTADD